MRVQFALCAQTASVDRATNRISIFNVIDHIPTASLPIILPSVTFVAIFESDRHESANFKGRFEATENGTVIAMGEVPVSFINSRLARVILTMNSIHIRTPGTVAFQLTIPGEVTAEARLQVVNLTPKSVEANPSAVPRV